MRTALLTTTDNPFDPFEQFDEWFQFDTEKGYHTCAYLARIAKTSSNLSEKDYADEVERAIDEIIELNILGIYKKVVYEEPDNNYITSDSSDFVIKGTSETF